MYLKSLRCPKSDLKGVAAEIILKGAAQFL